MLVVIVLLVLLGLAAGVLYLAYSLSLEGRLRRRVARCRRQINARQINLRQRLALAENNWRQTEARIVSEGVARVLAQRDVGDLDKFPGIGPKTVAQLKQAGLSNLWQVYCQGLGGKLPASLGARAGLVHAAVTQAYRETQQDLQQHPDRLPEDLRQSYASYEHQSVQELTELRRQLEIVADLEREVVQFAQAHAAETSLWAFLRRWYLRQPSAVLPELLHHPLLDAERQFQERIHHAPPTSSPPPVNPMVSPTNAASGNVAAAPFNLGSVPPPVKSTGSTSPGQHPPTSERNPPAWLAQALTNPPTPRVDWLDLEIRTLYMLARADGRLSQQERNWIAHYCQQHLPKDQVTQNRVRALCVHYETAPLDEESTFEQLGRCADEGRWRGVWPHWIELARLGTNGPSKKWSMLERLAQVLKFPVPVIPAGVHRPTEQPRQAQASVQKASATPASATPPAPMSAVEARRQLGLDSVGALTAELIRQQYEKFAQLYDPAKEQVKGADFVALAQQKRQEIRQAALLLLRELNVADPERYLDEPPADKKADFTRENPGLDAIMGL